MKVADLLAKLNQKCYKGRTVSLDKIITMVPPPEHPTHSGQGVSWNVVQDVIGVALSQSLDRFGRAYGSGWFTAESSLQIFNPYDPAYESVIKTECETYVGLRDESPEYCPYDCFFPDKKGLFPLAASDIGFQFYLLITENSSEEIVVFNDRSSGYLEFAVPIFTFFHDFLCNRIHDGYFDGKIRFRPERMYFPNES